MNAAAMQNILVAMIVAVSAVMALQRILPSHFRRMQSAFARRLGRTRHPRWVRLLGRWMEPREAREGGCGSGQGCASCGGCGAAPAAGDAIPLVVRPRPSASPR